MATFAAQVSSLDDSVGRLMTALRETKQEESTLVVFLSDNGASDRAVARSLDKPGETWRLDGTPTRVGNDPSILPGPADTFVTAGIPWANLSNAPFREHKSTNYEGGISTPCIVYWPERLQKAGSINHTPAHITDLLATFLDAAHINYPEAWPDRDVRPTPGVSLLPLFRGEASTEQRTFFWATTGCRAVRSGNWKLVSGVDRPWELFDMARDRTELHDLAKQMPERVQMLEQMFEAWHKN